MPAFDPAITAQVLLCGGAALVVVTLLLGLLRRSASVRVWGPVMGTACASLLVGFLWMRPTSHDFGEVASVALQQATEADSQGPLDGASLGTQAEQQQPEGRFYRQLSEGAKPESKGHAVLGEETEALAVPGMDVVEKAGQPAPEKAPLAAPAASPPASTAGRRQREVLERVADHDFAESPMRPTIGKSPGAMRGAAQLRRMAVAPKAGLPAPVRPAPTAEAAADIAQAGSPKRRALDAIHLFARPAEGRVLERLESLGEKGEQRSRFSHPSDGTRIGDVQMLYWNPFLVTDEMGRASFEFDVPHRQTELILWVDGHAQGRLGSLEERISIRPAEKPE